jgi:hypothetical protein
MFNVPLDIMNLKAYNSDEHKGNNPFVKRRRGIE